MSSKKIYLIRHGQTDFNLQKIVQGSGVDSSLNAFGRAQADVFFSAYKHIPFDKVYTSALKRSQETVVQFVEKGIPVEKLTGLNEICWGTREGERITPEEDAYYHHVLDEWRRGNTSLPIEGGESPEEVLDRMKPAVDHILSEPEETILICMHGRAMRIFLCYVLKYPLRCMDLFEHENLCLYILKDSGSGFAIETYNDVRHLSGLAAPALS